jgi:hypothetical protein
MDYNMQNLLAEMKRLFAGKWAGQGFAKFPTIDDTFYTERLEFVPDEYKDAIFFNQKTWYKNDSEKNGHTVFWDTGFIFLQEERIHLHSAQVGGRMEIYDLIDFDSNVFTFNSSTTSNDPGLIRSQRVFTVDDRNLNYKLNMATQAADFQNHLSAQLTKSN